MEGPFSRENKIYSVSEINRLVRLKLEGEFSSIFVEGEISNLRCPISGHFYFTLKDEFSQLKAIMFKSYAELLPFRAEDGMKVIAQGELTIYEARGEYQLNIYFLEPKGIGALQLAFEQLKRKLAAEGLFDEKHKKKIPPYPMKIGIITSPTGAAIRDILRVIKRRFAEMEILIFPTRVQGEEAAKELAYGIEHMNTRDDIDVLILTRGGGSLEDIWPFNEEIVARAIFASRIPIISAVGHEIDYTISDLVADLRAPTPSAAAELVVRNKKEIIHNITNLRRRLITVFSYLVETNKRRLTELIHHPALLAVPGTSSQYLQRVDELHYRLSMNLDVFISSIKSKFSLANQRLTKIDISRAINETKREVKFNRETMLNLIRISFEERKNIAATLAGKLDSLNPLAILNRGYAICTKLYQRDPLLSSFQVTVGDKVNVRLSSGDINCAVEKIFPEEG
jgi:exodeoxyribonuclease VII large subunit